MNLMLVQNLQAEIIIVKRLILGRNNVIRVRVEPRSCDKSRYKNDALTHSVPLPTSRIALAYTDSQQQAMKIYTSH